MLKRLLIGLLLLTTVFAGSIDTYKAASQVPEENIVADTNNKDITRGGSGDLCYEHVKNIKQTESYNCGPTTVLQSLYGMDSAGQVAGSTDEAKIATLEDACKTSSAIGTYVYKMVEVLNEYNIYGRVYQYTLGSSFGSIHSFKNCIATSLTCGKPVVLHADTYYLAYYNGNSYGHYLSLDVYDRRTETVRIVDCNYMTDYYGIHTVSVEEAYNCISASGRYLIH